MTRIISGLLALCLALAASALLATAAVAAPVGWDTTITAQGPGPALSGPREPSDDEVRAIARELQCPICQSTSVADSPTQLAAEMRSVIRAKLRAGETRAQIIDYFVQRYGEQVLLRPPASGWGLAAWAVPLLVLAGGLVFVGFLSWRWTRRGSVATTRPTSRTPEPVLDEYERRVALEVGALAASGSSAGPAPGVRDCSPLPLAGEPGVEPEVRASAPLPLGEGPGVRALSSAEDAR